MRNFTLLILVLLITAGVWTTDGHSTVAATEPAAVSPLEVTVPPPSPAPDQPLPADVNPGIIPDSLIHEGKAAINRGLKWLLAQQNAEGYWSNREFPALTGLAVWALAKGHSDQRDATDRAIQYILSCVQADGGIYQIPAESRKGGGLANYNTAICMVALHAVGDPKYVSTIQKARQFVAKSQHFGDDIYRGGMGYDSDTGRPYADLSNSYLAYEAMRLTRNVEDLRAQGEQVASLDWDAAIQFIQRVQNLPGSNDQPWASDDPAEKGGFTYKPDSSMAGSYTNADGAIRLRSYGSMTYAGLLSFIYAQVDKTDPRVRSAFEWTLKSWSLDENPGMGRQGLYYYYNVLAKALAVYGQDLLTLSDGRRINWRTELIKKLVGVQKIEPQTGHGYWVNEEGRWWEADPVLVTCYSLLALEVAVNQ